jgi:hypothetical protein
VVADFDVTWLLTGSDVAADKDDTWLLTRMIGDDVDNDKDADMAR